MRKTSVHGLLEMTSPHTRSRDGSHTTADVRRKSTAKSVDPGKRVNVTRDEFASAMAAIEDTIRNLQIQFQRIAQIQAEVDNIKRTLARRAR